MMSQTGGIDSSGSACTLASIVRPLAMTLLVDLLVGRSVRGTELPEIVPPWSFPYANE